MGRRGDRRPKEVMNQAVRAINATHETGCGRQDATTAQITMVLLHGSLRTWGEFLRRLLALAKRRRMRGYDAVTLSAACNSPALVDQGLPGGVANTAANRNQIQWAGSVTVWAQARPIHVVLIARNIQEGVDIMENITAGGAGTLVDIRDVTVDRELSREDRIAEFVRQIKNPYRFKCGRFTVHASFASSGATLEECIKGILR